MKIEQYINIKTFLSENRTELWNKLVEQDIVNPEYHFHNKNDMDFTVNGYYETADDNGEIDLIESEHICGLFEGMDLSFDRKYVTDMYGNAKEFEIEVNGKTIYGLSYNM